MSTTYPQRIAPKAYRDAALRLGAIARAGTPLWILATLLTFLLPQAGHANCAAVPRAVIALYDGSREVDPRDSRLHRHAELPLNHLGYHLLYVDISGGPDAAEIERLLRQLEGMPVAATLSWFNEDLPAPVAFAGWAHSFRDSCGNRPRTVILGETGLPAGSGAEAERAYLSAAGIVARGGEITMGVTATLSRASDIPEGFEADFAAVPGKYDHLVASDVADWLVRSEKDGVAVDLAVIGPGGGYAHETALMAPDGRGGALWRLDPFDFFARALGRGAAPVPDATTETGRRIYFSTVNGEGWTGPLPTGAFGETPQLAAEVVEESFILPYPDLPVTVAIATGDLDPVTARDAAGRSRAVAERLAVLPQVDLGTLGRSMVHRWSAFDPRESVPPAEPADLTALQRLGAVIALPGSQGPSDRRHDDAPFDLPAEIAGAAKAIGDLSPRDAPPMLVWSGDARPFAEAVRVAADAALPAIGGGGGFVEPLFPSVATLGPLTAPVGDRLQVLAALADDRDLAHAEPVSGLRNLFVTLAATETPRRLKPFHLSYTARAASSFDNRMAVRSLLDIAQSGSYRAIPARDYVALIGGWAGIEILPEGERSWRIRNRGRLQTLRLDAASAISLDLDRSEGVLGARRLGEALYVALDPAADAPLIALADNAATSGAVGSSLWAALAETGAPVSNLEQTDCGAHIHVGQGPPDRMAWWTAPGQATSATLRQGDIPVAQIELRG